MQTSERAEKTTTGKNKQAQENTHISCVYIYIYIYMHIHMFIVPMENIVGRTEMRKQGRREEPYS